MYSQINIEIGFRILSAVEREGRSPLSKGRPTHAVGIDKSIEEVRSLLEIESDKKAVTVILHGLGGMGKTTLAEAVFSEVVGCKYSKVRLFKDINSTPDIMELQKQILEDLAEPEETIPKIKLPEDGQRELERVLANVDAFIYIDNVLEESALRQLLPHDITKAKKVRLLLTARNDVVKISCSRTITKIYEMKRIQDEDALTILETNIKHGIDDSQFKDIIKACGGIPLLLTLAASIIGGANDKIQEAYSRLMRQKHEWTGDEFVQMRSVFAFAYDSLPGKYKDPFLDICAYFNGWKWDIVQDIVGEDALSMFQSRALVTKATNGDASVHDVILALAHQKSGEESNGKKVRLRFTSARELEKFLEEEDTEGIKGIKGIKGISLARDYGAALHICASRLDLMHNSLRVLHLETPTRVKGNCNKIFKELISLKANIIQLPFRVPQLKQLRYLSCEFPEMPPTLQLVNFDGRWQSRAFQVLSTDFIQLRNLRVLIFKRFTKLKELPKELGKLESLRVLELIGCESIRTLPEGLDQLKNLKELVLKRCRNLTELCNDFSSLSLQIDLSEYDRSEQFPGDGSCPSTDISVQALSISESQKENIENNVLSEFDRMLNDGRGQPFHLSHLPPNTPVLVLCDRGLSDFSLPNFPWNLIWETIGEMQITFKIIYVGPHFDEWYWSRTRISVIRLPCSRVEKVLKQVCLTLDAAVPSHGSYAYLQMHTKTVGEKSDNYRPCWRFLTEGEVEEFVVCNSGRYLRLKQLQDEKSSNIEMLRELFATDGDQTTPVFQKNESSEKVTTCGVDHFKGKTILLDLRSSHCPDDIGLRCLKEMKKMYEAVAKKRDLEIISIPITEKVEFGTSSCASIGHENLLSLVPWFVFPSGTRAIRKVALFFLTKQCGWEEGDECEKWFASINCIIEPNGRVIPCRPFTKYTEAKSTQTLEFLFTNFEKVSDQLKRLIKWGVNTVHEEIENLKNKEWEQLKSMSTLEFLFNHLESTSDQGLESTSDQVKNLMRQGKIICLHGGVNHWYVDADGLAMDQFKKDIHIITLGDIQMKKLFLTDTIYKNCYYNPLTSVDTDLMIALNNLMAIPMEKVSLKLSSHEHMRFLSRLHYLKEEINRIKESDKKLSELKCVLHSFQDANHGFMTFMDQDGKVVATLDENIIKVIFEVGETHRAERFIKSMMKDIEGGGKEMHAKDPGVSDSLSQNRQTASTSVAVEQKNMDAYFERLLEYISELWGVELYQLLKFNKDGKKSSPSRDPWPASGGFCMLQNLLSEGTHANWVKEVISQHPEEGMCEIVIENLLKDIEEENWGVAGLLAVADLLERFDSVSANRIEWLLVLEEMLKVAKYIKQLNKKPELLWRRIKRVATVLIVIYSIACMAQIEPSKFALFELETVDQLQRIKTELKWGICERISDAITEGPGSKSEKMCDEFDLFFKKSW